MRRIALAGLAVVLCVSGVGCGHAPGDEREAEPLEEAHPQSPAFGFVSIASPEPQYEEYRIPQSCTPGAYGARFLVAADSWANAGRGSVGLLDMNTGVFSIVIDEPQNDGFTLITSRCSDGWIAWEELRGDEQDRPLDVEWRLYAAPILEDGPSVGPIELIASSVTSIHSRPLFQLVDDTLYWMTNSAPNPRQEGAVRGSRVDAYDLRAKTRRVVYETGLNTHTAYVDGSQLIVSVYLDAARPDEQVRVIDLASGHETFRRDLENGTKDVSHWPTYREGRVVWGELAPTASRPVLMIATEHGEPQQLALRASDPVFVGDFMAFETPSSIEVANLNTKERYTLYSQQSAEQLLLYLLPAQPWRESELVAWGTCYSHPDDPAGATFVRRYRF